ncbi:MAG: helix-turn-helix transcriptional regulator [Planctomycetes bacterium]|nr:helix-turn-helix transcriptional regulator [Planctomycetota bacterium]
MKTSYANLDTHLLLCRFHFVKEWTHGNLSAPYWRLYWNRSHGMSVVARGQEVELAPGRIVLIPPDTSYSTRLTDPAEHLYLHFMLKSPFYATAKRIYEIPVKPEIKKLTEEVAALCLADGDGPSLRLSLLSASLIHYSLAELPPKVLDAAYSDTRVEKALQYMRDNLEAKIANDFLAREAGMNTNSFIRLFKEIVGETPQARFARMRIEHACVLLSYTDKTIDEIATETGFCDRYHFTKIFRKLRKIGPAAFKREMEPLSQINHHRTYD